jgi:UDP-N-acetylmuramoyl-L-alanyl-D-glutamate--2,6-diaminopimelate ligase
MTLVSKSSRPGIPLFISDVLAQAGVAFTSTRPLNELQCLDIVEDSGEVRPGSVFVALPGNRGDGRAHVPEALARGAVAIVLGRPGTDCRSVPVILVDDPRRAYARLVAAASGLTALQAGGEMTLAGVTGTNGKSTTAHLIHEILENAGHPAALLGTIRYELAGVVQPAPWTTPPAGPLARALVDAHSRGARHGVMEVSSHALVQGRTAGIRYSVAVFTNLTGDHLDYHGDQDSYLRAKKLLFDSLDSSAVAVVNADDPASPALLADCRGRVVRFGLEQPGEVRAEVLSCDLHSSRMALTSEGQRLTLSLPLVGRHNVANAAAAAAAARALGLDWPVIAAGLERTTPVRGRLQQAQPEGHPVSIFVDYAHTDDALANVLGALRPLTRGRLWCVFGCGGDRDRSKRPRMAAVSARLADRIIVTSDNPRSEAPQRIIDDILSGFPSGERERVHVEVDRAAAIARAVRLAQDQDVVLIAGKGHEDYQLIGDRRLSFDDLQVVRDCLTTTKRA